MVAKVTQETDGIDILASNAGVPTDGMCYTKPLESTPEDWQKLVNLNMFGLMNICHATVAGMVEHGYGRVIAITSEAWQAAQTMSVQVLLTSLAGKPLGSQDKYCH